MDLGPRYSWRAELAAAARTAFGLGCRVVRIERLRDASKKGVYRLEFGDGASAIGYVWDETENFWPTPVEPGPDRVDPFSDASGADLFEAAHGLLDALGVRVPEVYLLDRSRTGCQADIALVEDVRGGTLETLMASGLPGAPAALAQLAASLEVMHRHRSPRFGKIAAASALTAGENRSCEQVVLDRALGDLAEAAHRVERIAAARGQLEDVVRGLAAAGGCGSAVWMSGDCGSTGSRCTSRSSPGRCGCSTVTSRTASRCSRSPISIPTRPSAICASRPGLGRADHR